LCRRRGADALVVAEQDRRRLEGLVGEIVRLEMAASWGRGSPEIDVASGNLPDRPNEEISTK
jgi:hypothetical protein